MPHECVDCGEVCDDGSSDVFEGCPSCGGTKFFYVREVDSPDEPADTPEVADAVDEADTEARSFDDEVKEAEQSDLSGGQSTLEDIAEKSATPTGTDELTDEPSGDLTDEPTEEPAGEPSGDLTDAVEIQADSSEHESQQRARAVTVGDDLDGGWPETPDGSDGPVAHDTEGAEDESDGDIVEAAGDYVRAFGGKLTGGDSDGQIEGGGSDDEIVDAEAGISDARSGEGTAATMKESNGRETARAGETIEHDGKTYRRVEGSEAKQQLAAEFETIKIVEPGSYELNLMNLYDREEKIIALQEDGRYQVSLQGFDE